MQLIYLSVRIFFFIVTNMINKTDGFIKAIRCVLELLKWSYSGIIVEVVLELVD